MPEIAIVIDGQKLIADEGQTILEVAQEHGIKIPTLCHHPALQPEGACRMCLVEVNGKLQPACAFPISVEMSGRLNIQTHSPRVLEARKFVLELLLSDHPLDCLTCEAAGRCDLQDLAYEYGVKESPYRGKVHSYAVSDPNPFFERDYNKCILCRRCTRACRDINGVEAIGILWRGFNAKVGTAFDGDLQDSPCEFCGMCVELCPTGALIPKSRHGQGRTWELEKTKTICNYCGVGCQLYLETRDNRIVQVSSDWNGPANHGWTCVKGRFGWDFVNHPDRLTKPLIRRNGKLVEVEWNEALGLVAGKFAAIKTAHGNDALAVLASAKCTNEENYVIQKFTRAVLGTNNVDHCARL